MRKYEAVINGNISVHKIEAPIFDVIHQEIWNKREQKRLIKTLRQVTNQIKDCTFKALDFGAGTGNVTEKLLKLGYQVTAIDLSPEMCHVLAFKNQKALQDKKLKILNLNLDNSNYDEKFDLVTTCSVLHHIPDYKKTLEKLAVLVKSGGFLYIGNEDLPSFNPTRFFERLLMKSYYVNNQALTNFYFRLHKIILPKIDYSQADVHNFLDWQGIIKLLISKGFETKIQEYYRYECRFTTPLTSLHKVIIKANTISAIAEKK